MRHVDAVTSAVEGVDGEADLQYVRAAAQLEDFLQRHPDWPAPLESLVIREKRATFRCEVGINSRRPGNATALANLWLAGDYTDTGYPATLEGAVRSGVQCAREIIARCA